MFIRQKFLKHAYTDSVTDCVLNIFSFGGSFEGNNKYSKKGITSAMKYVDLATFSFTT